MTKVDMHTELRKMKRKMKNHLEDTKDESGELHTTQM